MLKLINSKKTQSKNIRESLLPPPALSCHKVQKGMCVYGGGGKREKRSRKSAGTVPNEDGLEFTQHLDLPVFPFQEAM